MNGWMRLWVLITAIWVVVVAGITISVVMNSFGDVDGPWMVYNLSDKAKPFFQNLEPGEEGPAYTVEFSYTDGTKQSVRFPLLDSEALVGFEQKIKDLAKVEEKKVSENEIRRFVDFVTKINSEAMSALVEYREEVKNMADRKAKERGQIISVAALFAIIPPIILLLLGYGIAWVRRGFA